LRSDSPHWSVIVPSHLFLQPVHNSTWYSPSSKTTEKRSMATVQRMRIQDSDLGNSDHVGPPCHIAICILMSFPLGSLHNESSHCIPRTPIPPPPR
jgi:hypothetical protein